MTDIDLPQARRPEAAEAAGRRGRRAYANLFPEGALRSSRSPTASPFTIPSVPTPRTPSGWTVTGPVAEADLERLEAFYRRLVVPSSLELCPLADPTLCTPHVHGDRQTGRTSALFRPLPGDDGVDLASLPPVRQAVAAEAEAWASLVARGFSGQPEVTQAERELGSAAVPRSRRWLLRLPAGGRRASGRGSAELRRRRCRTVRRHHLAGVSGLGRKRPCFESGDLATAAGCDLATTGTVPESISQRTVERVGFRLADQRVLPEQVPG